MATAQHSERRAGSLSDVLLDLVVTRVRLAARRRAAWLAYLRIQGQADSFGFDDVLRASLDDRDSPEAEWEWFERAQEVRSVNEELHQAEHALSGPAGGGLRRLAELFRLTPADLDLLQTCLAPVLDPSLGIAYGHLQNLPGHGYPTQTLAARLFGY
ncbi:MAG: hypothetical protein ABIZ80_03255, partial [Bryobacteraceae bacterium]